MRGNRVGGQAGNGVGAVSVGVSVGASADMIIVLVGMPVGVLGVSVGASAGVVIVSVRSGKRGDRRVSERLGGMLVGVSVACR